MPYHFNFRVSRGRVPATGRAPTYAGINRVFASLPRYNYIPGRHALPARSARLPKAKSRLLFGGRRRPGFITRGLFRLGEGADRVKFKAPRKLSAVHSRHLPSTLALLPPPHGGFSGPRAQSRYVPVADPALAGALAAAGQGATPQVASQIGAAIQAAVEQQRSVPSPRIVVNDRGFPTLADIQRIRDQHAADLRFRMLEQERQSRAQKRQARDDARARDAIADAERQAVLAVQPYGSYNVHMMAPEGGYNRVPALVGPAKRRK